MSSFRTKDEQKSIGKSLLELDHDRLCVVDKMYFVHFKLIHFEHFLSLIYLHPT